MTLQSLSILSDESPAEDILPPKETPEEETTVMFQTGYPYIGVPIRTFRYIGLRYSESTQINCPTDSNYDALPTCHWNQSCDDLLASFPKYNLSIGINDSLRFEIPFENLLANFINDANETNCRLQIGLMPKAGNVIVLGDSFFMGFVGIFDLENKRLGIAKSSRSLPGNTMVCDNSTNCSEPIPPSPPSPPAPDPQPKPVPTDPYQ